METTLIRGEAMPDFHRASLTGHEQPLASVRFRAPLSREY